MAILVAGGAGYIGSHTCVELLNRDYEVVVVDNLYNSSEVALERVQEITGKTLKFYKGDILNREDLEPIFENEDVEAVINFAGLKAVGESVEKPELYYDNNLGSTITLCRVMARQGCKKLIFSSSATVYSADNAMPLTENSKTGGCTNPYGWTKYFGERILTDIAKADPEWSVVLLRYFNPVGAHPSGLIGEDPKGIPNNLTPYVAKVAVGQLPKVSVYGNDYDTPDGTGVRDYIHVVDLAKGHVAAIDGVTHSGVYVYNLGTGNGYSVLQVIGAFEEACGHPIPYVITGRRDGDIAACYADCSKAKRELNWQADLTIDDMCDSLWHWQSKNPNGYNE